LPGKMTTSRLGAVAAPLPNGHVLIAGGGWQEPAASSAEVFDPSTGKFTELPRSMTTERSGAMAAPLPNGGVLIAGGGNLKGGISSMELSTAEVFEPGTLAKKEAGQIRLVTCAKVAKNHKTKTRCTTKLFTVSAAFTADEHAALSRGHVTYATGSFRNGQLIMRARRRLAAGRYTVMLEPLSGGPWIAATPKQLTDGRWVPTTAAPDRITIH